MRPTLCFSNAGPAQVQKLVYRSRAFRRSGNRDLNVEIQEILGVSRANNSKQAITGALMLSPDGYAQVLEGPAPAVAALFDRISSDPRHKDVKLLYDEPHERRDFGNWSMAFVGAPELLHIELASTAYRQDINIDNGASDILMMLQWLLFAGPFQNSVRR